MKNHIEARGKLGKMENLKIKTKPERSPRKWQKLPPCFGLEIGSNQSALKRGGSVAKVANELRANFGESDDLKQCEFSQRSESEQREF